MNFPSIGREFFEIYLQSIEDLANTTMKMNFDNDQRTGTKLFCKFNVMNRIVPINHSTFTRRKICARTKIGSSLNPFRENFSLKREENRNESGVAKSTARWMCRRMKSNDQWQRSKILGKLLFLNRSISFTRIHRRKHIEELFQKKIIWTETKKIFDDLFRWRKTPFPLLFRDEQRRREERFSQISLIWKNSQSIIKDDQCLSLSLSPSSSSSSSIDCSIWFEVNWKKINFNWSLQRDLFVSLWSLLSFDRRTFMDERCLSLSLSCSILFFHVLSWIFIDEMNSLFFTSKCSGEDVFIGKKERSSDVRGRDEHFVNVPVLDRWETKVIFSFLNVHSIEDFRSTWRRLLSRGIFLIESIPTKDQSQKEKFFPLTFEVKCHERDESSFLPSFPLVEHIFVRCLDNSLRLLRFDVLSTIWRIFGPNHWNTVCSKNEREWWPRRTARPLSWSRNSLRNAQPTNNSSAISKRRLSRLTTLNSWSANSKEWTRTLGKSFRLIDESNGDLSLVKNVEIKSWKITNDEPTRRSSLSVRRRIRSSETHQPSDSSSLDRSCSSLTTAVWRRERQRSSLLLGQCEIIRSKSNDRHSRSSLRSRSSAAQLSYATRRWIQAEWSRQGQRSAARRGDRTTSDVARRATGRTAKSEDEVCGHSNEYLQWSQSSSPSFILRDDVFLASSIRRSLFSPSTTSFAAFHCTSFVFARCARIPRLNFAKKWIVLISSLSLSLFPVRDESLMPPKKEKDKGKKEKKRAAVPEYVPQKALSENDRKF